MSDKELWLQNTSGMDINLSDLGVKVAMGKTVNVYAYNPYLTEIQVNKSMEDGSLAKKLKAQTLKVVEALKNPKPHTLDHIKESNKAVDIVKGKSSVVIDTKELDVLDDKDLGDIADYGFEIDPALNPNVSRYTTEDGAVVVKQKQDSNITPEDELKAHMEMVAQKQGAIVMKDKMMPIKADDQLSTAISPPEPEPEVELEASDPIETEVDKQDDGMVAVSSQTDATQENKTSTYDSKVATKTSDGVIVMELKEEKAESKEDK